MREATLTGKEPTPVQAELVAVNGIDLFVRSVGEGPDVVVLHGGPGASHISVLPAIAGLASGRRLRHYDQRGCGESRVSQNVPLDWQYHLDDLRELLDFWQIDKATILGHSWGALLSLLFATQHPDRIQRLVLVTPASISADGRHQFLERLARRMADLGILSQQRDLLRSDLRKRDLAAFRLRAFELTLAPYLKDPQQSSGIAPFRIRHRVREAVWRSLGDYDLTDEVSALSVPALVVHGRFDPIPLSSSLQTALLLDARLEVLENSGHMPFVEEHDRFMAVVGAFLPSSDEHKRDGYRARIEE